MNARLAAAAAFFHVIGDFNHDKAFCAQLCYIPAALNFTLRLLAGLPVS
jgi:hypothetical protein